MTVISLETYHSWARDLTTMLARHRSLAAWAQLHPRTSPLRRPVGLSLEALDSAPITIQLAMALENLAFVQHPHLDALIDERDRINSQLLTDGDSDGNGNGESATANIEQRISQINEEALFFSETIRDAAIHVDSFTQYWQQRAYDARTAIWPRPRYPKPPLLSSEMERLRTLWFEPFRALISSITNQVGALSGPSRASRLTTAKHQVLEAARRLRSNLSRIEERCASSVMAE